MINQPINPHLVQLFAENHQISYHSETRVSYCDNGNWNMALDLVTGRIFPFGKPGEKKGSEYDRYRVCQVSGSNNVCVVCCADNGTPESILGLEERWVKLTHLGNMYFVGVKEDDPDTEHLVDFCGRSGPKPSDVSRPLVV